jgi:hypothetical protein
MPVQDNERERELCRSFNLIWNPNHQRDGVDAQFRIKINGQDILIPVEVKSTTGSSVSTARDVGMDHIRKWRSQFWVIGYFTKEARPNMIKTLCLSPSDMEPWIASIEQKVLPDFQLAGYAARRIEMDDLFAICGQKEHYPIADAKKLHKLQWSAKQYKDFADHTVGRKKVISKERMLELLRLRSQYISERGATLNNPHVSKTFLKTFEGTSRVITEEWASKMREVVSNYLLANPSHPFGALAPSVTPAAAPATAP